MKKSNVKKRILSAALTFIMGLSLTAFGTGTVAAKAAPLDSAKVERSTKANSVQEALQVKSRKAAQAGATAEGKTLAAKSTKSGVTVKLGGLKGPTTIGLVKLLDNAKQDKTANKYDFTMGAMPDEIAPKLLKGELDIIAAPVNMGAVLYNKSKGRIRMLAINTLGVLYIGEKGRQSVKSMADLKGKTIYATGKGATPEYVLTKLLSANKLDITNDVKVEWKSEPTEVLVAVKKSKNAVALLPQPFMTAAEIQAEGFKSVLDLTKEWEKMGDAGQLVTAGFFTTADYLKKNKKAVDAFLEDYSYSAAWVNNKENADEAAKLVEEYGIVKAAIAKKAIPFCNVTNLRGKEMKKAAEGYLSVLNELNSKSIGGKLPKKNFYYVK